jgi:hypothetical protein
MKPDNLWPFNLLKQVGTRNGIDDEPLIVNQYMPKNIKICLICLGFGGPRWYQGKCWHCGGTGLMSNLKNKD